MSTWEGIFVLVVVIVLIVIVIVSVVFIVQIGIVKGAPTDADKSGRSS